MKMYVATGPIDFSEIRKEVKEPPKIQLNLEKF
jgi:hypothetical protein